MGFKERKWGAAIGAAVVLPNGGNRGGLLNSIFPLIAMGGSPILSDLIAHVELSRFIELL